MSRLEVSDAIALKEDELEQLRRLHADYPDACYARGRLYEVDAFGSRIATTFVLDDGRVRPCITYGDDEEPTLFVVERSARGVDPVVALMRLLKLNRDLVMGALK